MGHIVVIGDGGLLGEIVAEELSRRGTVMWTANVEELTNSEHALVPDVILTYAELHAIGDMRRKLRQSLPPGANPLMVVLSQTDPHIYFTRLGAMHIDRCRLGFNEAFNEIADRLAAGPTTAVPVRAGSV